MTPDIKTLDPVPTTNTHYQLSTRSEQKEVQVVEQHLFLHTPRSKDNNINSESTKELGCTHTHINGSLRLLQFAGRVDLRMRSPPFSTSTF